MVSNADSDFGRIVVALELATPEQVERAQATRRVEGGARSLGEVLAAQGVLRAGDLERIHAVLRVTAGGGGSAETLADRRDPTPSRPPDAPTLADSATLVDPPRPLPPRETLPGSTADRYELLDELGRGGMGVVYRARQRGLDRVVALKLLVTSGSDRAEEIERFHREAHAAARLRHPHIVEVFDIGELAGRPYIAMEFVDGLPFDRYVAESRADLRTRVDLIRRVAEAVEHAHAQGIVHRDLKPANVLVDRSGSPRVADFGLAKEIREQAAELTRTGAILGTPAYMSPEQASGDNRDIDARTDVWSLGAMLYEALTDQRPFAADDVMAILFKVVSTEAVPPRERNPKVHVDLDTICLKALEKERDRRYPTAAAFAADLGRFLAGEPIEARPLSGLERLGRRLRKHARLVVPLAVAAVVVIALGLAMATAQAGRARDRDAALAEGRERRAAGRAAEARDAFQRARTIDPSSAEAEAGFRWADAETRRLEAEARAAQTAAEAGESAARESLRKAGLVARVLVRWSAVVDEVAALDAIFHDHSLGREQRREKGAAAWGPIERFRTETPADPTSQAVMLALSGWARRLAGFPEEGLAWIAAAAETDPDVPYAPLVDALVRLFEALELQRLPSVMTGPMGIVFGPARGESENLVALRAKIEADLDRAAAARVWGKEGSDDVRPVLQAIRALQRGEYERAEADLDRALAAPDLRAFATGLFLARAKARYLRRRFASAIEDMAQVLARRPGFKVAHHWMGEFQSALALESDWRGTDPRALLRESIDRYTEAIRLVPTAPESYFNRGSARRYLANAEFKRGVDSFPIYRAAIDDYSEGVRLLPGDPSPLADRSVVIMDFGLALRARGEDGESWFRRALADCEAVLLLEPNLAAAHGGIGDALAAIGEARMGRGEDPREDFARAAAAFGAATAIDPGEVRYLHARGMMHGRFAEREESQGRDPRPSLRAAIGDFEAALERRADYPGARLNLASAFLRLGAADRLRGSDARPALERAVTACDAALKCNPELIEAYARRGEAHMRIAALQAESGADPRVGYQAAIRDAAEALARNPRSAAALHLRAASQRRLAEAESDRGGDPRERFRLAIADCDAMIALNPQDPSTLLERGNILHLLGQAEDERDIDPAGTYARAIGDFDAALRLNPEHSMAFGSRANAHRSLALAQKARGSDPREELERALADAGEVLRRVPGYPGAYLARGAACHALGEWEEEQGRDPRPYFRRAVAECDALLEKNPRQLQALNLRGIARVRLGRAEETRDGPGAARYADALADFNAALEANPGNWRVLLNLGILYEARQDWDRATEAFEACLRIRPTAREAIERRDAAKARRR